MRELSERELWFRARVGQRIFRNDNGCSCCHCQDAFQNGLIIRDEMHADYLYDTEADYAAEQIPLRYFDSKDEATEFSVQQQK